MTPPRPTIPPLRAALAALALLASTTLPFAAAQGELVVVGTYEPYVALAAAHMQFSM